MSSTAAKRSSAPEPRLSFCCKDVSAGALLSALKPLSRIPQRNPVIPITGHAWLRFEGGQLVITTTDLDRALTIAIDAEGEGATTTPADRLLSFASLLPKDQPVSIEASDGFLEARSARTVIRLPTLPVQDYPTMIAEAVTDGHKWKFSADRLSKMLKSLEGAMGRETAREYLMGACFSFGPMATLAATNAHILGEEIAEELSGKDQGAFIVPRVAIPAILDICDVEDVTVRLNAGATAATFQSGSSHYRTKLIEARYPEYRRSMPDGFKTLATVDRREFVSALRRGANVMDAMGSEMPLVAVKLGFSGGELTVSSGSKGEFAEDACGAKIVGPDVTVGASFAYLKWASDSLGDCETIEFQIVNNETPFLVVSPSAPTSKRVVFPRRF